MTKYIYIMARGLPLLLIILLSVSGSKQVFFKVVNSEKEINLNYNISKKYEKYGRPTRFNCSSYHLKYYRETYL